MRIGSLVSHGLLRSRSSVATPQTCAPTDRQPLWAQNLTARQRATASSYHHRSMSAPATAPTGVAPAPARGHLLIVGSGAVGLGCALQLLLGGYMGVTIVSDRSSPHTTSDQAGASLRPGGDKPPPDHARVTRWGKATTEYLSGVRRRVGAGGSGITLCSGYEFWNEKTEFPFWRDQVYGMREVEAAEQKEIGFEAPFAWFYTTYCLDVSRYLQYLTDEITRLGGRFVQAKVESLTHLRVAAAQYNAAHAAASPKEALDALDAAGVESTTASSGDSATSPPLPTAIRSLLRSQPTSCVINCTGLAARTLVPDPLVVAGKGCIVLVKCPGLTHFYTNLPLVSYIIPRTHDVVLGGSVHVGDDSPETPDGMVESIIADAAKIIPELATAEVLRTWVGFRPARSVVRLELVRGEEPAVEFPAVPQLPVGMARLGTSLTEESIQSMKDAHARQVASRTPREVEWASSHVPKVPIIHNYGHGGSGITLHMGCAMEVVELVKQIVRPTNATSSMIATARL